MLVRNGGIEMSKIKPTTKTTISTATQYSLDKAAEIYVSERKLEPRITIGFAKKAPKFVVERKHTVIYEE